MTDPSIPVTQIARSYEVSRTTLYKVAPRSSAATGSNQTAANATMSREDV